MTVPQHHTNPHLDPMRGIPSRRSDAPVVPISQRSQPAQQPMNNREAIEGELMHLIWDAVSSAGRYGYRYQVHVDGLGWVDAPITWRLVRLAETIQMPNYPHNGPSAYASQSASTLSATTPLGGSSDVSPAISASPAMSGSQFGQLRPQSPANMATNIRPVQSDHGSARSSVLPSLNDLMQAATRHIDKPESR